LLKGATSRDFARINNQSTLTSMFQLQPPSLDQQPTQRHHENINDNDNDNDNRYHHPHQTTKKGPNDAGRIVWALGECFSL